MQIKVQKWGNSLAIRIPKSFAVDTDIDNGSYIDLSLKDGSLIATPVKKYKLEDLIKSVNNENIHKESDSGDSVGREVW